MENKNKLKAKETEKLVGFTPQSFYCGYCGRKVQKVMTSEKRNVGKGRLEEDLFERGKNFMVCKA